MAKRKSSRSSRRMEPAQTNLLFTVPAAQSQSFVDTQRSLSQVNRRLYEQGRMVAYQGLTFVWRQDAAAPTVASIECKVKTASNTWVTHNAFVKGKALWHQMQDLVLEDNPSIKGKWHDYKIELSTSQTTAKTLLPRDGAGNLLTVAGLEWNISTYVMPQHEVDPATGLPLAADEKTAVLVGPSSLTKEGLIHAYQESRATVQSPMPNVPAGMSGSFFNLLTDSGSQEPELADVIEDENDLPPYDRDDYPGGATNAPTTMIQGYAAVSAAEVDGRISSFIAPCGLIELEITAFNATGDIVSSPAVDIILHVAPGMYKGTASVPMGQ